MQELIAHKKKTSDQWFYKTTSINLQSQGWLFRRSIHLLWMWEFQGRPSWRKGSLLWVPSFSGTSLSKRSWRSSYWSCVPSTCYYYNGPTRVILPELLLPLQANGSLSRSWRVNVLGIHQHGPLPHSDYHLADRGCHLETQTLSEIFSVGFLLHLWW